MGVLIGSEEWAIPLSISPWPLDADVGEGGNATRSKVDMSEDEIMSALDVWVATLAAISCQTLRLKG